MQASKAPSPTPRLYLAAFASAILIYLAVALACARTRVPYVDEAWFSMPAWNLATHGSFGTPVIEPSASPLTSLTVNLTGIRSHTYWNLPLPIIVEAGWFRILGFSVFTMRLFSTFWAVLLLGAWFVALRRLGADSMVAGLAVVFTAADPVFLDRSGFGRFDLMACALGFCGLAAYLVLRGRSLPKALLAGHAFVAAAGMTHPIGGLLSLPGLLCLIVYYDRKRLRWSYLPLVALPYLAAAAGMAIYVFEDPASFKGQFFGITGNRLGGIRAPLSLVWREILRYLQVYGLNPEGTALSRLKLLILVVYVGAAALVCFRTATRRRYRGLLLLAAVYVAALTVFDGLKAQWYVVYIIPFFGALLAAALAGLPPAPRRWAAIALAALCLVDVASVARLALADGYDRVYRPMLAYLNSQAGPHGLVMGSAEIGLAYGLDRNLIDDIRLGCRSGKTPRLVVVETRYREAFQYFRAAEPLTARCIGQFFQDASPGKPFGPEYTVYTARLSAPDK